MVSAVATVSEKSITEPNKNNHSNRLLRCKQSTHVSTFNVRTLNSLSQTSELAASAAALKIDIICVQEHRFYHDDIELKYHKLPKGWTFISASAWKNSMNSTIGGVGMLLSPQAMSALNSIEKIVPRMIIANFNGNPIATVISCYSPTNVSNEEDVIGFYHELSSLTRAVPKHNVLIIGGDMNAQLGKSTTNRFTYHSNTNRNGNHMNDFINENEIQCVSTKFQKSRSKLWTHTYANGSKAQLDYMFVNNKWKNSVMNTQAYNSFEGVSSDHRIVTTEIRLSLRSNKAKTENTPRYDWTTLTTNTDIRDQYTISVRNRFAALIANSEEPTPTEKYSHFITAHESAAAECIPQKPKVKKRVPWETEAVEERRNRVKALGKVKNERRTKSNVSKFNHSLKELSDVYDLELEEYVKKKINEVEQAAANNKSAVVWKIANEISGRKSTSTSKIRAASQEERLKKWKDHFQNLLGKPPRVTDTAIKTIVNHELDIKRGNFTLEELQMARKKCKDKKAAPDIPPETWTTGAFDDILLELGNDVYNQRPVQQWTEGCILPFPKKGDLGCVSNYRGITLTHIAAKIYNTMLLNRIQPEIEKILRRNQNGFRKGRSTVGQILTVRRIIEGVRAKNLQAVLLFVDFSKAFDSIHRGKMEQILLAYGIPDETVSAIMMLYKNTTAKVQSPDGDTETFDILAGVLQGDTLAPFLFIICLDYVLRTSIDESKELGFTLQKARGRRYPAEIITDADYADDLALFADTIEEATQLLHILEKASGDVGLYVNAKKTEFMSFNLEGSMKTLGGDTVKQVLDFIYLGSEVSDTESDVNIRIGKAWAALNKMKTIWESGLSHGLKRKFFRATVESVLLYGAVTWTLTKHLEQRLSGTYTRMLRAALNISWKEHPTIKRLYGHLPNVITTIRERRMRFAGHCWRHKEELAADTMLWQPRHGTTSIGRPAKTYVDQLREDTGLEAEDLSTAMMDRDL